MVRIKPIVLLLAIGTTVVWPASNAKAQNNSPSHVYQAAQTTLNQLDKFADADFCAPAEVMIQVRNRKPRHALQKAKQVYGQVQTLRAMNGLTKNKVEPLPVRKVQPQDVRNAVVKIRDDVTEMASVYGVETVDQAEFVSGKTPTDVYENLLRVEAHIRGLAIPDIVPNDVLQLAETLVSDIKLVAKGKNIATTLPEPDIQGKSPKDVFIKSKDILAALKRLNNKPGYNIPGDVGAMPRPESYPPAVAMEGIGHLIAEVGALKYSTDVDRATRMAELKSGKTPTDVYAELIKAETLVKRMLNSNS